jgi:predicted Fe-Mo cluster-binding NifX family protein
LLKIFLREKEGFNLHGISLLLIHDIGQKAFEILKKRIRRYRAGCKFDGL